MKQSDELNVKLAQYLDEKFESVSIYPGGLSTPGPTTVWFDVDPSREDWLVIRRLQEFLQHYPDRGRLQPYTYLQDRPQLGWNLKLPPSQVEVLEAFIHFKAAKEAVERRCREAPGPRLGSPGGTHNERMRS